MRQRGTFRAALLSCLPALALCSPAAAQTRAEPQPIVVTSNAAPVAPNLFGTIALPVKAKRYADAWYRSRMDASRHPAIEQLVAPARGLARDAQIAFIQSAVHARIRWLSDATEWGAHDYWASAAETLSRGAGDMEDRAIVKLQALKALGVPGRDLYLTMGRDKVGGPITVLIVRLGKRFLVLDDLGGKPVPTELREGFEPMISFGSNTAWLHGRKVARAGASTAAAK